MVLKENWENMRTKGYYFLYAPINTSEPDGIEKKILAQRQMFLDSGIELEFEVLERNEKGDWLYKEQYSKASFIYFRKSTTIDWRFLKFYKRIKKNGNVVVFMEIPTFPYDGEYGKSLRSKATLAIDHFFRRFIKSCIDRIIITGNFTEEDFCGVKTINIINGIDFEHILPRNFIKHEGINLACVAKFSPWHGYERLIRGLVDYYRTNPEVPVTLHMVGEGVEKTYYEKLVKENNLQDHVIFHGKLTGSKLDHIYDITDIGICSLGRYKSGIEVIGDLKSREFMVKGIPMVCGCKIDALEGRNYPYALFFPNDDSIIDINRLLDFLRNVMKGKESDSLSGEIREISQPWIDYSVTFKDVIRNAIQMVKK